MFIQKSYLLLLLAAIASVKSSGIYNPSIEKCCNGIRYTIPPDSYRECCGDQMIDYSVTTCCNRTSYPLAEYPMVCCGDALMNNDKSFCVDNVVVEVPEKDRLENRKSICSKSSTENEFFDSENKICCEGTVLDLEFETTDCCGAQTFDYSKSVCCGNINIFEFEDQESQDDYRCCGDSAYFNTKAQLCCNNVTVDIGDITWPECCGTQIYDKEQSICCDETIVDVEDIRTWECCGSEAYDLYTQECCGTTTYQSDDQHLSCCNDTLYDSTIQHCCFDRKTPDEEDLEYYVVSLNGYDPNSTTLQCCNEKLYCAKSQICCNGELKENIYGKETFSCCGDEIIDNTQQKCCNDQVYNSNLQTCCDKQVLDWKKYEYTCFVDNTCSLYNSNKQMCCRDGIADVTEEDKAANRNYCCEKDSFYNY
ncbi:hypothetical protein CHUAL_006841 [Chamberlinius hualienensis]